MSDYWSTVRHKQVLARGDREQRFFQHVLLPQASRPNLDAEKFWQVCQLQFKRQDVCYQQRAQDIITTSPIKASL
jgi:hypothetical protein